MPSRSDTDIIPVSARTQRTSSSSRGRRRRRFRRVHVRFPPVTPKTMHNTRSLDIVGVTIWNFAIIHTVL